MHAFSRRFDAALAFAARAHRTQVRKGTDVPYIIHPVEVAIILGRHGFDEDVQIAGLLHDTVEDTEVSVDDVRGTFGDEVARLVTAVTEVKDESGGRRPWRVRKEEMLAHLEHADRSIAALKAADALHNAQATITELDSAGVTVWSRFNAPPADSAWYYGEVARLCARALGDHPLARELLDAVDTLRARTATA
jgi:(p)ppGpp synthase/HD superfamily hydrolase